MSAEQSEPMVLAIGVRDDFLHVYQDGRALLDDNRTCAGGRNKHGALEFFDSDGYRLAGEYDQQGSLLGLTRTADSPDPELVRLRMQSSLDHLRWYIKGNPEKFEADQMTVDEALAFCPDLEGSSDLATSMRTLATHFGWDGRIGIRDDHASSFCRITGWC